MTTALQAALAAEKSQGEKLGAYAIATGLLGNNESADDLLAKLERMKDDRTRGYIAVALGLMNAHEAIEPLRRIVKSAKYRPGLLKDAAVGLGLHA